MSSVNFENYSFRVPPSRTITVKGSLSSGQVLHLSGASGIGKTTFLRSIAGLRENEEAGSLKIDGAEQVHSGATRPLAMTFQGFQLFSHLSVLENLFIAFEWQESLRALSKDIKTERVQKILGAVNLSEKLHAPAHTLSGGEHQRVAICRALLTRAKLVLLDEPFSALDKTSMEFVRGLLQEYLAQNEASFILVGHRREDLWQGDTVKELIWKEEDLCLEF